VKTIAVKSPDDIFDGALKVVILYDDIGHAAHATALLERVGAHANKAMKWDVKSWRLDALKQPALAAVTNLVAADADLILLALSKTCSPPAELLEWLELWSANRQIEDAALAVLGPEVETATPLLDELKRFARRRGLAFLGADELWDDKVSAPAIHPQRHLGPSSLVELTPTPAHWGIND
jgi:hypothetical protein